MGWGEILFVSAIVVLVLAILYRYLVRPYLPDWNRPSGEQVVSAAKKLPAFLKWLFGVALPLAGLGLLIWGLVALIGYAKGEPEPPARAAKPPALTPAEKDLIWVEYSAEPQANGWLLSPHEITAAFDRATMQGPQYVMNLVYLDHLMMDITVGGTDAAMLKWQTTPSSSWTWLRDDHESHLRHAPLALSVQSSDMWRNWERFQSFQVRIKAQREDDRAQILRTERFIRADVKEPVWVMWGRVPTRLNGQPLAAELTVVFLKGNGEFYPLTHQFRTPPAIFLGSSGGQCVRPVYTLQIDQATMPEERLAISIPPDFGDAHVLVNWKIDKIR